MKKAMSWCLLLVLGAPLLAEDFFLKGITVSCRGFGREWGTDAFARELDRLKKMGVTSVAIHPYARIGEDGTVSWRVWHAESPPAYIVRPIVEAHRRGMTIMIKPHLAYWGSSFSWRGAIRFDDPAARARFYKTYKAWIVALAELSCDADIFVVGTELKGFTADEGQWRDLVDGVRAVSRSRLTYAANWDHFHKVRFWDALDYIGVQGYFPITKKPMPEPEDLLFGWRDVLRQLSDVHNKYGKKVVFTEMGYNRSLRAASEPWAYKQDAAPEAEVLQARCLEVGLRVLRENEDWLSGVYLWKWFVGPSRRANFYLDTPSLHQVIRTSWLEP